MKRLLGGVTLGIAAQLSSIGLLLTSAWLIVRAAEHPPVLYLMVAIVSVRFFGVGRAAFHYGERLLTHDVALRGTVLERLRVYRLLDRAAPWGLARHRRGDLVDRIVGDVESAQDRLLRLRLPWLYAIVSSSAVVALLSFIAPAIAMTLAVHVTVCAAFARLVVARLSHAARSRSNSLRGAMSADASALVLTSRDLVAHGLAVDVATRATRSADDLAATQRTDARAAGAGTAFVLASTGATILVLSTLAGGIAPVLVGVVLLAPVALIEPLQSLVDAERLRPEIVAAHERLADLASLPAPIEDPVVLGPLPAGGDLVVDELVVGWDRPAAAPVSFAVRTGELVGLTGPSGVGKSTLAMTLLRLIAPQSGSVTLGGVDFSHLAGSDVRTRVGMTGQDDIVFDTTIRENLKVADPEAAVGAMHDALRRAGLERFVAALPKGLDTPVGENGNELSGGERQRLGIARLLLARHDILVLDEPTEHLDEATATDVMRDIVQLSTDHGVLLISHSPAALARCTRIVLLQPPVETRSATHVAA
ncbi:thiol reductant ABC exporter subunit CydC [Aeromicrobium sp. 9AM]|uniref:thiol reductant ABC exporter subunit CydC n=1 Tax=Aeromicrobium sp. 9AM TaxID=2653126 RepID=UPI0012F314FD|nr:thiol reductant ABC exporter subunit CydC [Aeromicrobium sp. 9AM]VXC11751.1 ATP-binding cassette, subfamily C, CydC [Aeromicrobium sp. 9AM]